MTDPNVVELRKEVSTDHLIEGATGRSFVIERTRYLDDDGSVIAEETHRRPIEPGSFIFVPAGATHRFESFSADFAVWVAFYGPEGGEAD